MMVVAKEVAATLVLRATAMKVVVLVVSEVAVVRAQATGMANSEVGCWVGGMVVRAVGALAVVVRAVVAMEGALEAGAVQVALGSAVAAVRAGA